jgi:hypothetical protein
MSNRNRITSGGRLEAWQESVVSDRGGDASSSARSRLFPSSSLPPRPPAARPSASNSIASRLRASRPLSAPGDGSSGEIQSEYDFYSASSESVGIESSEASESGYDASPEEGPHYTLRELMDKQSDNSSASDSDDPAVQNLRAYGANFGYIGPPPWAY